MKYLIVNLKTYENSFDKKGLRILKEFEKNIDKFKKKNVKVIICPNTLDLKDFSKSKKISIFSQSIDGCFFGANTGKVPIDFLKKLKVSGTLINHSENRISFDKIKDIINLCRKSKILCCVCAQNLNEVKKFDLLKPNFIAYEPKKLIGGNISVSNAKSKVIEEISSKIKNSKLLVGAGVKNKDDIKNSLKLKAKGVLIASKIANSKNLKKDIIELLEGF